MTESPDKLRRIDMLRRMKLIRCVDEAIATRYSEQKMRCPTHLSVGQETVAAAAGVALEPTDQAVSTHRSHAHYLGKGGALDPMMAEIYGKVTGCCMGKGGSMHLIDPSVGFIGSTAIVGNSIPVGVGAALSNQMLRNGQVSCIFLGDAAIEEGAFHEAINFAVLRGLPALFICENNLYSVYSPLSVRQPEGREIWKFVEGYGIPTSHTDGYDAGATLSAMEEAVEHVRSGKGPFFAEFATYRWREHCGPNYDNDIGYRTEEEYRVWRERDPLPLYEQQLIELGDLTQADAEKLQAEIDQDVDAAFLHADEAPFPPEENMLSDLFAD